MLSIHHISLLYLWLWQDGLPPLSLPQQTPLSLLQTLLIHFHLSQDHLREQTHEREHRQKKKKRSHRALTLRYPLIYFI